MPPTGGRTSTIRRWRTPAGVFVIGGLFLLGGYLLKAPCVTRPWDGYQWRTSCYNDIAFLYPLRDLDRGRLPYFESDAVTRGAERDVEYPVLTGLYMGAFSRLTDNLVAYFDRSAAGLAVFGLGALASVIALVRSKWRTLLYAASPAVVLYAFHNWDLIPVAFAAAGLLAFSRRRDWLSGALLALGASAKLYPAFLVVGLAAARWHRRRGGEPAGPLRLLVSFGAVTLLVNLPVFLANPGGWLYPWQYQARRFPNYETWAFFVHRHLRDSASLDFWLGSYPRIVDMIGGLAFATMVALLVWRELQRAEIRPYALCLGILTVWLLTAKVFSPQYMLWVAALLPLVHVRWPVVVAVFVADVAVWWAVVAFFLALQYGDGSQSFRLGLLEAAVLVRYGALVLLLWESRRAADVAAPVPAPA